MESPKIIKKIEPINCPHCKKDFFVGTQSMMSSIVSILTDKDIENAKKSILEKIEEIQFASQDDKNEIIMWLKGTLLDFSDVEPLLKQIAMEQINKIQANKPEKK